LEGLMTGEIGPSGDALESAFLKLTAAPE